MKNYYWYFNIVPSLNLSYSSYWTIIWWVANYSLILARNFSFNYSRNYKNFGKTRVKLFPNFTRHVKKKLLDKGGLGSINSYLSHYIYWNSFFPTYSRISKKIQSDNIVRLKTSAVKIEFKFPVITVHMHCELNMAWLPPKLPYTFRDGFTTQKI